MELDIDFTKKRSKWPLWVAIVLVFLHFCFSTPTLELNREASCSYIEKLQTFYYDKLGFSEGFVDTASDWLGFWIFDYSLVIYLFLVDNKYFALVQLIGVRSKGSISQTLKVMFMDSRPAWTCSNLDTAYCRASYGLTATHVWEATVCYLSLMHFFFIHNGLFNKRPRNILVQILRYIGIFLCVFGIWITHQSRLVLGAHYLYQDFYGFLCGCVYFYTLYYYFYPWAMDPGRRFTWAFVTKFQCILFVLFSLVFWGIYAMASLGKEIPEGAASNLINYCGYLRISDMMEDFVNFDISDAIYFYASWFMLWLLPLKHYLPKGHFWVWSIIGLPLFFVCTWLAIKYWAMTVLDWSNLGFFLIDYCFYAFWVAGFLSIPFLYYLVVLRLFSKEYKEKMSI